MSRFIDVITYNGERDLFDIRYNILKDYVDEFIVVEFDKTFSGRKKKYKFRNKSGGKRRLNKVSHFVFSEKDYSRYEDEAYKSPYTRGASHWKREFMQKESIKLALENLNDDDLVFVGDCDEIWDPAYLDYYKEFKVPTKLKLKVYTYYLNNRSSEEFWGTLVTPYWFIYRTYLNNLRNESKKTDDYYGWHFTSMNHQLRDKLLDSYTEESYATDQVMNNLEDNIENNRDFLGRDFTFTTSEDEWPEYLKSKKHKYKHLLI